MSNATESQYESNPFNVNSTPERWDYSYDSCHDHKDNDLDGTTDHEEEGFVPYDQGCVQLT